MEQLDFPRDLHFMNFMTTSLHEVTNSQSPIIIRDQIEGNIIISDTTFQNNTGLNGGAIEIRNSNKFETDHIGVIMKHNNFNKNMAYFSGNAVYIENYKTIKVCKCNFNSNYGRNKG